jgi:hypothetical protein
VTAATWLLVVGVLLALGRRQDAREVAAFVPDCLVLCKRLLVDRRVPRRAKVALALLVATWRCRFDLVPDLIPVAGRWTTRSSSPSSSSTSRAPRARV